MRDIDRGGFKPRMKLSDLGAHLHAKLGIEVRQRFVEQEHIRIANNRPPHGHALTLSTG